MLALSPDDVLPAVYLCTNKISPDHENMVTTVITVLRTFPISTVGCFLLTSQLKHWKFIPNKLYINKDKLIVKLKLWSIDKSFSCQMLSLKSLIYCLNIHYPILPLYFSLPFHVHLFFEMLLLCLVNFHDTPIH